MCGRYSLSADPEAIAAVFGLEHVPTLAPRFNIAPTQNVPVVRVAADEPTRALAMLHWGLIPSWSEDPSIGSRMINARAETVAEKPAFRAAFRKRRCLIVTDGFYEWMRVGGGKQPYLIRREDGRPFAFAGLWERWVRGAEPIESCAVITTEANDLMRPIHDRMPVILDQRHFELWLDPHVESEKLLLPLLEPAPPGELVAFPVSKRVNSPVNDDAAIQDPVE
jgi:putative SOS response-associated peptidase YedK